jgi:hypothetical protein
MLRTPSRVNGTCAPLFSRGWAHTGLSTKVCASEGDGCRSTGSGMDIVKLAGAEGLLGAARLALRAAAFAAFKSASCRLSTRRCASPLRGRRRKAAGAQLGLRPSCRTWLVLCRRFDPNGNIDAELPRNSFFENGRGNRIRTCDPLVPNQMRYQTAPCPEPTHRR